MLQLFTRIPKADILFAVLFILRWLSIRLSPHRFTLFHIVKCGDGAQWSATFGSLRCLHKCTDQIFSRLILFSLTSSLLRATCGRLFGQRYALNSSLPSPRLAAFGPSRGARRGEGRKGRGKCSDPLQIDHCVDDFENFLFTRGKWRENKSLKVSKHSAKENGRQNSAGYHRRSFQCQTKNEPFWAKH